MKTRLPHFKLIPLNSLNAIMWSGLRSLYKTLISEGTTCGTSDLAPENEHLNNLDDHVTSLKSRTGKLWTMYMDFVLVVRLFIRAERTGIWILHVKATQLMLPFFAAAGHDNYLK